MRFGLSPTSQIMQAVEELNYKPNELAQNLFRNKSGFIGIVVKNLSHPFMASLVKHVENNLYTNGYKCMLCRSVEPVPQCLITFILKHRNLQIKLKAENLSTKNKRLFGSFPFFW